MVEARLDTGERLLALNEVFVGHHSHQSARYRIATPDGAENQSSSGLIVASGTGATGWARSIMGATHEVVTLAPEEAPSRSSSASRSPAFPPVPPCALENWSACRSR